MIVLILAIIYKDVNESESIPPFQKDMSALKVCIIHQNRKRFVLKMPIGASIGSTFIFEHKKRLGMPI